MKCQQCPQSFSDMKSLQIHTFLEHNRGPSEARNTGSPTVLNLSQQARHPSPSPDHHQQIPCQICGVKLPNQIIYQQVTKRTKYVCVILTVKYFLFQHLQTHATFRPFVCSLCDAGFTSLVALETHSRLHAK